MSLVVGVDGCPGGWAVMTLQHGGFRESAFVPTMKEVASRWNEAAVIAVDVPIGLSKGARRRADSEAKRLLGRRHVTVFLTPPTPVLEAPTYEIARRMGAERYGWKPSAQAFALRRRIFEVAGQNDPRLREVHPEVSFAAMARRPLPSKKTPKGAAVRRRLLEKEGVRIPPATDLPEIDLLDAAAAAWTAYRISRGVARCLPDDPVEAEPCIWY